MGHFHSAVYKLFVQWVDAGYDQKKWVTFAPALPFPKTIADGDLVMTIKTSQTHNTDPGMPNPNVVANGNYWWGIGLHYDWGLYWKVNLEFN